jgi:hypothetical protein
MTIPPLWSSGQSSWLRIQRSQVRFPACQIFWDTVSLERIPVSLVMITEELLQWKVTAPVYKTEIEDRGGQLR